MRARAAAGHGLARAAVLVAGCVASTVARAARNARKRIVPAETSQAKIFRVKTARKPTSTARAVSHRRRPRLPPPALPSPPKKVAPPAHATAGGAPQATTPVRSVAEHASATKRPSFEHTVRLRGSTAAATTVAHVKRRGLAAVASTWLGKVLLVATGISAIWALIELLTESNLRRRQRRAVGSFTSAGSLLSNLQGGKRRREQLLSSYRRHERTSSRYGK